MASDATRPRLGVTVPLANESETINEFMDRVTAQLGPSDKLYCVVDNVSKDDTRQKIEARQAIDPRVQLVWAPQNRCVVDAYFAGFRAALADNCVWILEMDGGLSHLPEQIPQYIKAMGEGYDFVAGSRFSQGGSHRGSLMRYLISKGGTVMSNLVLGTKMTDMCSGFECFTHEALSYVVHNGVRSRANFFQTEIRFMLHDWKWIEVPITYANPSPSVGKAQIMESLRNLKELRRRGRPPREAGDAEPTLVHL